MQNPEMLISYMPPTFLQPFPFFRFIFAHFVITSYNIKSWICHSSHLIFSGNTLNLVTSSQELYWIEEKNSYIAFVHCFLLGFTRIDTRTHTYFRYIQSVKMWKIVWNFLIQPKYGTTKLQMVTSKRSTIAIFVMILVTGSDVGHALKKLEF